MNADGWPRDTLTGAECALASMGRLALAKVARDEGADGLRSPSLAQPHGQADPGAMAERVARSVDAEGAGKVDPSDVAKAAALRGLRAAGMGREAATVALVRLVGLGFDEVAELQGLRRSEALRLYFSGIEWLEQAGPLRSVAGIGTA